jgi:hypothetical protein
VLSESAARWMLLLHTALGVAAVGASTHLVLWLRDYLRGRFTRHRAVRRFAWIAFALHGAAFLAGNVMYPTYTVEVRAAYLDNAEAVSAQRAAHDQEVARVAGRDHAGAPESAPDPEVVRKAAQATRWFDVKEHWIALGLIVSGALVLILAFWDPKRDGATLVPIVFGLAAIVAATVWLGAIIGVLTASWRAV